MSGGGVELRGRKSSPAGEGELLDLDEARAFYKDHAEEVVARMRKPSSSTNNPAAAIVAQCETDSRLRAEALCAVDDARRARDALTVLERTLELYAPLNRPVSSLSTGRPRSRTR
jgi:hypothetical protein